MAWNGNVAGKGHWLRKTLCMFKKMIALAGLYVMPQVLEQDKFADWWKFYLQPGHGWPTFCFVKQLGSLPLPRRLDNCDKRSFEAVQEVGRAQIQRIPLKCHFITTAFS